ncbi:biotin-dependent carboxyltransferase family protein [Cohaesibacter intestini]|uniref:5-oxoprolinase subunit C family protein n=1 Tax=Cohaesibacter intestini TaxID=2211145 RepID=UPI000DE88447|nr:biotin-dependent carboxyltransferase family protein [Cohaesibacter intestini]
MTKAVLEIVNPGMMATIQDFGRFGYQAKGVPTSGALDFVNLRLANRLVGNEEGQGALEFRIMGPTIRVLADSVRIALTGTEAVIELMEPVAKRVPSYQSVTLQKGALFKVGVTADTAVAYLAVEGGFDVPDVYASQSTYMSGGFGGFEGRALQVGDLLPLALASVPDRHEQVCDAPLLLDSTDPIRVVPGPQKDYFSKAGLKTFFSESYVISGDSNRMGSRLEGAPVAHEKGADINSDGIVTGAIQVPGNGLPIVLLADHQTTGGYPKIGCVASADLPRLGRMKPGCALTFSAVTVAQAEKARRLLEQQLAQSIAAFKAVPSEQEQFWNHLAECNLIDGVVGS